MVSKTTKLVYCLAVLLFLAIFVLYRSALPSNDDNTIINLTDDPIDAGTTSYPGHVITLGVWEQLTMGLRNMLQLQCWAGRLGLDVVQSSVRETYLIFTFNETLHNQTMEMGRMFDMEDWSKHSRHSKIAPLISRQEFMKEISVSDKNVILVQMSYSLRDRPLNPCSFDWSKELRSIPRNVMQKLHIVRSVCIDTNMKSLSQFDHAVYGSIPRKNSLVIFNEWRGFGSDRLAPTPPCAETASYACTRPVSASIREDAEAYAQRYLGGSGQYLAILARLERTSPRSWTLSNSRNRQLLWKNMEKILKAWETMKESHGLSTTFLAFDYGKFGSESFKRLKYFDSEDLILDFHKTIVQGKMSFQEWESSFEAVAHTNHSAYIAMLHMEILTNARCVILAGDQSNFLVSAYQLYHQKHAYSKQCCKLIQDSSEIPESYGCSYKYPMLGYLSSWLGI